ncbi:S8 family serine peptidase [Brevibacillus composti]|uniref:S8 family serine peptidase n=1 Tax=Brevibacillus composti TaxID=2796470 RepID=A0A7T5JQG8_9BACL|nr:S8 family serine peptidase [Brevibacillus composti]QUO43331.1 S8 family serine peptidase [Brevibacillus composti]
MVIPHRNEGDFSLRKKWIAALSATIMLSLAAGQYQAGAKHYGERKGDLEIEASEELSLKAQAKRSGQTSLYVIRFEGPIQQEWKDEVESFGIKLGDYLPDYSFVAKLPDRGDLRKVKRLDFVKDIVPFYPVSKVAPQLRKSLGTNREVEVAVVGFDKRVDMRRTVSRIAKDELSGDVEPLKIAKHISVARISGQGLEEVIQSEDVIAVLPVSKRKLHNDRAADIIKADELERTGYTGRGQIIGIADSGLDRGDAEDIHPDLAGQVLSLYAIGRKGDASDLDGHGTHVTASALGTGKASRGRYQGTAPEAKLVFHSMMNEEGELVGDPREIMSQAYEDGARIHSNSWGADDFGDYGLDSYLFDQFLWEHKDMTALVAAGNAGYEGYETIGSPATAKNVIAVGATENDRPRIGGEEADDPDAVADFSSRGPTIDGRLKPDLVAPGSYILSARSLVPDEDAYLQVLDDEYAYNSGTSMATPLLAGGVAQIRQFLREDLDYDDPSAALIKAMLISGADDLDEDMRMQGFGRANLRAAIETDFVDEKEGLLTGEGATYTVEVKDRSKPLAITLAWTDHPPSLAANRALVNDLNLTVTAPDGQTYNGNDFFRYPYDDEVDNLNNVEQVWIPEPDWGTYTVRVKAHNIPHGPQPYAIATSGKITREAQGSHVLKGSLETDRSVNRSDWHTIEAKSEGRLRVNTTWRGGATLSLTLYDDSGMPIAVVSKLKKGKTIALPLPDAGTYQIKIQLDKGYDTTYRMEVNYPDE